MKLTRPLVTSGISFLTSAMVVSIINAVFIPYIIATLIFLIVAFVYYMKATPRINALIILVSALIAIFSFQLNAKLSSYDLRAYDGKSGVITATVLDIKSANNSKTAYTVKITDSTFLNMPTGFKAIAYLKTDTMVDFNDSIRIAVKANKITSTPVFNIEQYYMTKGISITFSSYSTPFVLKNGKHDVFYYAKRLRQNCSEQIDRYVKRPCSGLLKAMLLGDKSDIDAITNNSIMKAGISHVFVVSGLHVSILSMLLLNALKRLKVGLITRNIIALSAVWGFVAITGFGIPAVRAGIMLTILISASMLKRKADSLTSLFLSGILIVLINPLAIIDPSFLLTFTATLGIILFAKPIDDFIVTRLHLKSRLLIWASGVIAVTFSANFMMLPIIIIVFKGISILSPITNLLITALLPFLLTAGILLLFLAPFPMLATFLGEVLRIVLLAVVNVSDWISSFSFSFLGLNYTFVYHWLDLSIILLMLTMMFKCRTEIFKRTVALCFVGFIAVFSCYWLHNNDNIFITTLNSSDAQNVIITYNNRATIISFADDNYIDISTENFLRSKNITRIDSYIFATSDKKNIEDTKLLTKSIKTNQILALMGDNVLGYSAELFGVNDIKLLQPGSSHDIALSKTVKASVTDNEGKITIRINVCGTEIVITNSLETVKSESCEILYFGGKYSEKLRQNKAKCVILLNRTAVEKKHVFKAVKAYEELVTLTVNKNGKYKLSSSSD